MTTRLASKIMSSLLVSCLALCCLGLAACGGGGEVKDGTYTGQSSEFEGDAVDGAGYGVATITIKDGVITECTFETFELDGNKKDENYGKSLAGPKCRERMPRIREGPGGCRFP